MVFSGNFSFWKKLVDKTWNLTFIEASLAVNKAELLPHLYNRWPKEWIAVYESQPEILRDISNSKLRILSFIIPPPDLHQRVSREPVRGSQEKGLAVDLHGRSRADVRQRIGQEPKFTACNLCVGRTRNVFRTVERYHRQFIQLQSFWSRLSHDVPLDRWDFLFVYCCGLSRNFSSDITTLSLATDHSQLIGFSFDSNAAATDFWQNVERLTSNPENIALSAPGRKRKTKTVKKNKPLPPKSQISHPCQFLHVTNVTADDMTRYHSLQIFMKHADKEI